MLTLARYVYYEGVVHVLEGYFGLHGKSSKPPEVSKSVASNALEETLLTGVNGDYCCVRTVFHLLHGYMLSSCGVVYSLPKSEILNAKGYCFCGGPYYVR